MLNAKVKPSDRGNLLFFIRHKIEGHAKSLLSNQREPKTLDELITLLKTGFPRSFNVYRINNEFRSLSQGLNETIQVFRARVSKVLDCGLEAAKDTYNSEQLVGATGVLKNTAVTSFVKGLRSQIIRLLLSRGKDRKKIDDFETVINVASSLEQEMAEPTGHPSPSQPLIRGARVLNTNFWDRKCFGYNQTVHLRKDCPRDRENWENFPSNERFRCGYFRKTRHLKENCFRKQNQGNSRFWRESSRNLKGQGNLHFRGALRTGTSQSGPLIASAKDSKAVSKST